MQDKKIIIISLVLVAVLAGAYWYASQNGLNFNSSAQLDAIKAKAEKFINENLVAPGTDATIKSIVEENGTYKIIVDVGGRELPAYISKDGKNFFPQVISMEAAAPGAQAPGAQTAGQEVTKTDKPVVELFVMSYCPYGLQAEKGLLPVAELLGSKIDFQLKFVDYAMHGDKEIAENLRQYAIQKNAPEKLIPYLKCFTKQDDFESCLKEAKLGSAAVAGWVSQADKQFQVIVSAADKSQWRGSYPPFVIDKADNAKYDVQGSPTLVINGVIAQSSRDPQSLLNLICSSFNDQPGECQQKLSASAPVAGFGEGTGSGTAAQCGN